MKIDEQKIIIDQNHEILNKGQTLTNETRDK